jgi:hypothetical protein
MLISILNFRFAFSLDTKEEAKGAVPAIVNKNQLQIHSMRWAIVAHVPLDSLLDLFWSFGFRCKIALITLPPHKITKSFYIMILYSVMFYIYMQELCK